MIFLYRARLLILSQPKTGTTALEDALGRRASIAVNGPPELKHVSYRGLMKFVAPWIEAHSNLKRSEYDVVAVMRDPIDWLGSWYRYRTREELRKPDNPRSVNYTGHVTFDKFVQDVCRLDSEQPAYAQIKTPSWVSLSAHGRIGVDRLYPYEDMSGLYELIASRTGKPIEAKRLNISPQLDLELSPSTGELLRRHFAFEFDLHATLKKDGAVDPRFRLENGAEGDDDTSPGV